MIPRSQGYVYVGSRRYNEWQMLAFEATPDREEFLPEAFEGPLVEQRSYPTPSMILIRQAVEIEERAENCSADELQHDRKAIEKDMMQDVGKREGDDRATENDPRSIKALGRIIQMTRRWTMSVCKPGQRNLAEW